MTLALRAQGMALARQHRWEDAENVFAEAVSLGRQMHFPEGEAEALYAYGLMYLQKGQPAMARKRLEEALAIFRRLGARAYIERTEQALHAS